MKIDPRAAERTLQAPERLRCVLLHGDDEGMIRERGRDLVRRVAGALDDPFRVSELDREAWARLPDEAAAMAMLGGRRVVRIRDGADALAPHLTAALAGAGDALIVIEAPGLARGRLRTLAETAPDAAAIACYPEEGRALEAAIRGWLAELGAGIEPDALAWLAGAVGGDRALVRGEVEKLALLAGAGGRVSLDMAREVAGDGAGRAGEDALVLATSGRAAEADAALEAAMLEGLTGVALVRMATSHLQRLHVAALDVDAGASAADAIRALRPPVFFKAVPGLTASLRRWRAGALLRALEECRATELACKQTGSRPELLARRLLARLAGQRG